MPNTYTFTKRLGAEQMREREKGGEREREREKANYSESLSCVICRPSISTLLRQMNAYLIREYFNVIYHYDSDNVIVIMIGFYGFYI